MKYNSIFIFVDECPATLMMLDSFRNVEDFYSTIDTIIGIFGQGQFSFKLTTTYI